MNKSIEKKKRIKNFIQMESVKILNNKIFCCAMIIIIIITDDDDDDDGVSRVNIFFSFSQVVRTTLPKQIQESF